MDNNMYPKDHISYSQERKYRDCGIQFEQTYIKGNWGPRGLNLFRGDVGHKVAENFLKHKLEHGEDLEVEEVDAVYLDTFDMVLEDDPPVLSTKELAGRSYEETIDEIRKKYNGFVKPLHKTLCTIQPMYIEEKWEFSIADDLPPIVMVVDVIESTDNGPVISDFKFPGSSPGGGDQSEYEDKLLKDPDLLRDIDTDAQVVTYQAGFEDRFGELPHMLRKYHVVNLKTPKIVMQERKPADEATIERVISGYRNLVEGVCAGHFQPSPHGHWACSPSYCHHWPDCKFRV